MKLGFMVLAAWLGVINPTASAMTLEVQGNQVFATGPVDDDLRKFEDAFAKPNVDTVVFVNSPGGDLWTGLRVGQLIADKGYKTITAGTCVSACSIMFMAGKERRFSDAFRPNLTYVGIHGAANKDTRQILSNVQPQIFAFYKRNMGDKFNTAVMNQALYDMEDAGALLFVFDPERSANTAPYHCVSAQTPKAKCTSFKGMDAMSLGVITHANLVKVDLPTAFKSPPTVFGLPLNNLIPDLSVYYTDLASRQCLSDPCKTATAKLSELADNKAIAVPQQGLGRGSSFNADSPMSAVLRAVYACNHIRGQAVRLCDAEIVNQYDLRPTYQASAASHSESFAKLSIPKDKFYASEEFGGVFTSANTLRVSVVGDITPQKIDGITTMSTQDLVRSMTSAKPPALVDVVGAFQTIPLATAMLNAGTALEDTVQDAALEKRFAALLALIAPDTAAPVVFFCSGRNCWLSVNAALRAKKIGYTNVQWYRGGLESWNAAGLPTAAGVIRAVVY
jgi:rhodanese-related sulfurtransferase